MASGDSFNKTMEALINNIDYLNECLGPVMSDNFEEDLFEFIDKKVQSTDDPKVLEDANTLKDAWNVFSKHFKNDLSRDDESDPEESVSKKQKTEE